MSVAKLLSGLIKQGVSVELAGSQLSVKSKVSPIPEQAISLIKSNKAELIAYLQSQQRPQNALKTLSLEQKKCRDPHWPQTNGLMVLVSAGEILSLQYSGLL